MEGVVDLVVWAANDLRYKGRSKSIIYHFNILERIWKKTIKINPKFRKKPQELQEQIKSELENEKNKKMLAKKKGKRK